MKSEFRAHENYFCIHSKQQGGGGSFLTTALVQTGQCLSLSTDTLDRAILSWGAVRALGMPRTSLASVCERPQHPPSCVHRDSGEPRFTSPAPLQMASPLPVLPSAALLPERTSNPVTLCSPLSRSHFCSDLLASVSFQN